MKFIFLPLYSQNIFFFIFQHFKSYFGVLDTQFFFCSKVSVFIYLFIFYILKCFSSTSHTVCMILYVFIFVIFTTDFIRIFDNSCIKQKLEENLVKLEAFTIFFCCSHFRTLGVSLHKIYKILNSRYFFTRNVIQFLLCMFQV